MHIGGRLDGGHYTKGNTRGIEGKVSGKEELLAIRKDNRDESEAGSNNVKKDREEKKEGEKM